MEKRKRKPTVGATIREVAAENDSGGYAPAVIATCQRCKKESPEIWGTGDRSIRRALASLRDGCPQDNFYEQVYHG